MSTLIDNNVFKKEIEKLQEYSQLEIDISRMWNLKAETISIIITGKNHTENRLTNVYNTLKKSKVMYHTNHTQNIIIILQITMLNNYNNYIIDNNIDNNASTNHRTYPMHTELHSVVK